MNARYDDLTAAGRRKITPESGECVYLIVIDEYAYFSATVGTKKEREEFASLTRDLVARGRAAGVIIILATQRPSTRSSTRPCGTCSATGGRSAAPPTPPPTPCSAKGGPPKATPPPTSTPWPGASAGCCRDRHPAPDQGRLPR